MLLATNTFGNFFLMHENTVWKQDGENPGYHLVHQMSIRCVVRTTDRRSHDTGICA